MTQADPITPQAEEVPADSTPPSDDPSVWGPLEEAAAVRWAASQASGQAKVLEPVVPSYLEMFEDYLAGQAWIGAAETPLVFHLKRLCAQLDRDPSAPAAVSSAYLQAFSRLDRRRPGAPAGPGEDPAQTSIFDELD